MGKRRLKLKRILIYTITMVLIVFTIYRAYIPGFLTLKIGTRSYTRIVAKNNFEDEYATQKKAMEAQNAVNPIYKQSQKIKDEVNANVNLYFEKITENRANIDYSNIENTAIISDEVLKSNSNLSLDFSMEELERYINMDKREFSILKNEITNNVKEIMFEDDDKKANAIEQHVSEFQSKYGLSYSNDIGLYRTTLEKLIKPSSVVDVEATIQEGNKVYDEVMSKPVIVQKGTVIVEENEIVTEHKYNQLKDLGLIKDDSSNNMKLFLKILFYCCMWFALLLSVIAINPRTQSLNIRMALMLSVSFYIPILASYFLTSNQIYLATMVLFFTTISTTYIGAFNGILLSMVLHLLLWPIYLYDVSYMFIYSFGIVICAMVASSKKRFNNSAYVIIITTIVTVISTVVWNYLEGVRFLYNNNDILVVATSTFLSTVLAVGFLPVFELFSDRLSPLVLIGLSQTRNPLFKKLILECPGTAYHSLMVATLAENAAEAINVNVLLCKVAAYYHDIGKTKKPMYFVENLDDNNDSPHQGLTDLESAKIITSHVADGVELAEKNHFPQEVKDIILEHHGTTYPYYFYSQACIEAKEQGLPEPDINEYRYQGRCPSTKESAIIMLADTCEAALKSVGLTDIHEVDAFIRKLVKSKITEDQLNNSKLSFDEIERIIRAFVQVYSGMLHERIKYPE